jgi:TRAP-type C4-dicarboxylate transport system permease small subunit
MTVVVHLSLLGFFVFGTYQGAIYALSQWNRTTPAMEIPGTFPISAISVGCAIMFMIDLEMFIDELRGLHCRKNSPQE